MNIGIDAKPLTIPYHCGLKHYAKELIFHLAKIDRINNYIIFSPSEIDIPKQKNFILRVIRSKMPWQFVFPLSLRKENIDILHILQQHGPIFAKHKKMIVTFHDVAPLNSYPKWHESLKYLFLKYYVAYVRKQMCLTSKALITVSEYSKSEIIKYFGQRIIFVIPEGVNSQFQLQKESERYQSKKNFFLTMTDFSPRKNIDRVMSSYSLLPGYIKKKFRLKIIVSMNFPVKKILKMAIKLSIRENIRILKDVKLDELITLYNKAKCFLYPSLYEGFGLPILEAMACGCPVITSKGGATEEIAGGNAYLVDPYSVEDISQAIKEIVSDHSLVNRLRQKGLKRIKFFNWKQTAQKTLEVYEQVYQT